MTTNCIIMFVCDGVSQITSDHIWCYECYATWPSHWSISTLLRSYWLMLIMWHDSFLSLVIGPNTSLWLAEWGEELARHSLHRLGIITDTLLDNWSRVSHILRTRGLEWEQLWPNQTTSILPSHICSLVTLSWDIRYWWAGPGCFRPPWYLLSEWVPALSPGPGQRAKTREDQSICIAALHFICPTHAMCRLSPGANSPLFSDTLRELAAGRREQQRS